ncbi:MAG: hypothetical protein KDB71_16390 [Mycobacterium sp.]|nr:hypothetical protein [Mycobacterium sp.]
MSFNTGIGIGLASLAVVGLSACTADKSEPSATKSAASSSSPAHPTSTGASTPVTSASTSSQDTPTGSTGSPMVGGMTECTKAALAEPATQAAEAIGADNVYTVDELNCADGWAVTSGLLASKENPQMGAPTSFIFEQEGQFWVPKDKAKVCGTNSTTTTPPADAVIPAALFLSGCAAG